MDSWDDVYEPAAPAGAADDWSDADSNDSFSAPLPAADPDAAYDAVLSPPSSSAAAAPSLSHALSAAPPMLAHAASLALAAPAVSRVLRPAEVDALRAAQEAEVARRGGVSVDAASALLRDRKWNVESVIGSLLDSREDTFKASRIESWAGKEYNPAEYSDLLAGTSNSNDATKAESSDCASARAETVGCQVCLEDVPAALLLRATCGHAFCLPCWLQYIFSQLSRARNAARLPCLAHKCGAIVGDRLIRAAAAAASEAQRRGLLPAELVLAEPATEAMVEQAETLVRMLATQNNNISSNAAVANGSSNASTTNGTVAGPAPAPAGPARAPATPATSSNSNSNGAASASTGASTAPSTVPATASVDVAILGRWDLLEPSLAAIVRRSAVEDSRRLQWCPAPHCALAVQPAPGATGFTCACGHQYCLACGHGEDHAPASCDAVAAWTLLTAKEGESTSWMVHNTKVCPLCRVRIEKNSGCNHMTCTSCRYEFCWICLGSWQSHCRSAANPTAAYRCNKFREGSAAEEALSSGDTSKIPVIDAQDRPANMVEPSQAQHRERQQQLRLAFYFMRYHNHAQGQLFAAAAGGAALEERMIAVQTRTRAPASPLEAQWLADGVRALVLAQRVLKHSYVVGFYQAEGPAKDLFEFSQQALAEVTEKLAMLVEETVLTRINPSEIRQASVQVNERAAALIRDISTVFTTNKTGKAAADAAAGQTV